MEGITLREEQLSGTNVTKYSRIIAHLLTIQRGHMDRKHFSAIYVIHTIERPFHCTQCNQIFLDNWLDTL